MSNLLLSPDVEPACQEPLFALVEVCQWVTLTPLQAAEGGAGELGHMVAHCSLPEPVFLTWSCACNKPVFGVGSSTEDALFRLLEQSESRTEPSG